MTYFKKKCFQYLFVIEKKKPLFLFLYFHADGWHSYSGSVGGDTCINDHHFFYLKVTKQERLRVIL